MAEVVVACTDSDDDQSKRAYDHEARIDSQAPKHERDDTCIQQHVNEPQKTGRPSVNIRYWGSRNPQQLPSVQQTADTRRRK